MSGFAVHFHLAPRDFTVRRISFCERPTARLCRGAAPRRTTPLWGRAPPRLKVRKHAGAGTASGDVEKSDTQNKGRHAGAGKESGSIERFNYVTTRRYPHPPHAASVVRSPFPAGGKADLSVAFFTLIHQRLRRASQPLAAERLTNLPRP